MHHPKKSIPPSLPTKNLSIQVLSLAMITYDIIFVPLEVCFTLEETTFLAFLETWRISAGKTQNWRDILLPFFCEFFFAVGWGGEEKEKMKKTEQICWRAEDGQKFDLMCFFSLMFFVETYYLYISSIEHGRWIESMKEKPMLIEKGHSNYWISIFSGSTVL